MNYLYPFSAIFVFMALTEKKKKKKNNNQFTLLPATISH